MIVIFMSSVLDKYKIAVETGRGKDN